MVYNGRIPDDAATDEAMARELRAAAKKMVDDWQAGRIVPGHGQSTADVFLAVANGVCKAIDASNKLSSNRLVISHRRLEPVKVPVDDRGRAIAASEDE